MLEKLFKFTKLVNVRGRFQTQDCQSPSSTVLHWSELQCQLFFFVFLYKCQGVLPVPWNVKDSRGSYFLAASPSCSLIHTGLMEVIISLKSNS